MTELAGKRILVVEDEPIVAMAIEDILGDLGCEVAGSAHSLDQAMTFVEECSFDAAILDINLNGERSYPAARLLASKGIPFVFATGYVPETVEPDLAMAPMVEKPYKPAQIAEILRQILKS